MTLDEAFAVLERAAVAGDKCPLVRGRRRHPGLCDIHLRELEHAGRIRIEISNLNWRRLIILTGPHAGAATADNPRAPKRTWFTLHGDPVNRAVRPSEEMLCERDARMAGEEPRSLTGMMMGDPPVGFSALDRRER